MRPVRAFLAALLALAATACAHAPALATDATLNTLGNRGALACTDAIPVLPAGATTLQQATACQAKAYVLTSIDSFGADPTGAADSTAAIQAAINSGQKLSCSGIYKTTATLNFTTATNFGQQLVGSGESDPVGRTTAARCTFQPTSAVTIAFWIDGSTISYPPGGPYVTGVAFDNITLDMTNMATNSYGFKQGQSYDISYKHVRTINDTSKSGFYFGDGAFVTHLDTVGGSNVKCVGDGLQDPTTIVLTNVDILSVDVEYCANFTTIGGAVQANYSNGPPTVKYLPPGPTNLLGYYPTTLAVAQAYSLPVPVPLTGAIISGGTGYDGGGSATFTNVPLTGGSGSGERATIVVTAGVVTSWAATTNGSAYANGDLLSASNVNLGGSGSGFSTQVSPGMYIALTSDTLNMQGFTASGTDFEVENVVPTTCSAGGTWPTGTYNDGTHGCLPSVWAFYVGINTTGCTFDNPSFGGMYLYQPAFGNACSVRGYNYQGSTYNYSNVPNTFSGPVQFLNSQTLKFFSDYGATKTAEIDPATGNGYFNTINILPTAAADQTFCVYNTSSQCVFDVLQNGAGQVILSQKSSMYFYTGTEVGEEISLNDIPGMIRLWQAPSPLTGSISAGGTGYDGGGTQTYTGVSLTGGSCSGVQGTVVVTTGVVTSVTPTNSGTGCNPGDSLTAPNTALGGSGSGFLWMVGSQESIRIVGPNGTIQALGGLYNTPVGTISPSTGVFTTENDTTSFSVGSKLLVSATAPTVASGFSTGAPSITGSTTAAFLVTIGATPGATGVLTMPAAATGWVCLGSDRTTAAGTLRQTASSTTSATFALSGTVASDILQLQCDGY